MLACICANRSHEENAPIGLIPSHCRCCICHWQFVSLLCQIRQLSLLHCRFGNGCSVQMTDLTIEVMMCRWISLQKEWYFSIVKNTDGLVGIVFVLRGDACQTVVWSAASRFLKSRSSIVFLKGVLWVCSILFEQCFKLRLQLVLSGRTYKLVYQLAILEE